MEEKIRIFVYGIVRTKHYVSEHNYLLAFPARKCLTFRIYK